MDIRKPLRPIPLQPMLISRDAGAHRLGVRLFEGQTPYSPGGQCVGFAVRRDGCTVPLTGEIDGNQLAVDLPAAAYALDGPLRIGIKNVLGDTETTVFLGLGMVLAGETDTVIDPGEKVPTLPEALAQLQRALAPAFSEDSALAAGDFVWKDGQLYRAKEAAGPGPWDETRFEAASAAKWLLPFGLATAAEALAFLAGGAGNGGAAASLEALKAMNDQQDAALSALRSDQAQSPTLLCLQRMNYAPVPSGITIGGRAITADRNTLRVVPVGHSNAYLSLVLTNQNRIHNGSLASFTPVLADLVPIDRFPKGCDVCFCLNRRDVSTNGSTLQVMYVSVDENDAITVLGRGAFLPVGGESGMRSHYPPQPPENATHFVLFYYSAKADHDFDCAFEIVPRTPALAELQALVLENISNA